VYFASATIVTSAILYQSVKGSVKLIVELTLGFLVIYCGVVLLQRSKLAQGVSDGAMFRDDLNQVQDHETEPTAEAIEGTSTVIGNLSISRQKPEAGRVRPSSSSVGMRLTGQPGNSDVNEQCISGFMFIRISWHCFFVKSPPTPVYTPKNTTKCSY
jgi:hypothetical protein